GEYAHTKYRVIAHSDKFCLHEIKLVTGRTHQIRVHYAYKGFPLIGDELYGGDTTILKRQALHCGKLVFRQPVTGDIISLVSPLPADIMSLFDNCDGKYGTSS
ncbi:MAG: RluA family pseudouridine synthase, partial [Ruminiclostridium sp.]|nr:RluA family pseudouridine synthase [Ruminiclostridium sp.]